MKDTYDEEFTGEQTEKMMQNNSVSSSAEERVQLKNSMGQRTQMEQAADTENTVHEQPENFERIVPEQPMNNYQRVNPGQPAGYQHVNPGQPAGYQRVNPYQSAGYQNANPNQSAGYQNANTNQSAGYQNVNPNRSTGYQNANPNQSTAYQSANATQQNDYQRVKKPKKAGNHKFWVKAVCGGLVFGLVAGVIFEGVHQVGNVVFKQDQPAVETQATADQLPQGVNIVKISSKDVETIEANDVSDIVKEVMPAIVSVNTVVQTTRQDFFGRVYSQEGKGAGSGFIFSQDGDNLYIATNNHVIQDAKSITVTFNDESSAEAIVKGTDPDADVAVLQLDWNSLSDETKGNIKVAVLGDSSALEPGNGAIAIGNALGYGQSVTTGAISAVERPVQLTDGEMILIQTSAAINPGNSGGPLLNTRGEVIGINTVKYSETTVEGMGFAIPINSAVETINDLLSGKAAAKTEEESACFGIKGGTITESMSKQSGYPQGVYVSFVYEGSAAYTAGIKQGDIIVGFAGQTISSIEELQELLENYHPGDTVNVDVYEYQPDGSYDGPQSLMTILGSKSDLAEE